MRDLSLRQLRAVIAVHKTGKIVSAARLLGLTQPAVTLQIRDAERAVGIVLFERFSGGMRPTAAGHALVEAGLAIEERMRLLSDEIEGIRSGKRGVLQLGVVSTAKYFAPAIIAAFKRDHPDIEVNLLVGNRAETIDTLRNHAVDLALMGRPPRQVPVRAAVFGDHPMVIIAPPGHPLASAGPIQKERIAAEQFLVREPGSGTRIALELYLGEFPDRVDPLGIEMGSNETIKQAVMAGLGIALISAHTIALEVATGRLAVLDVEGLPIRRQWFSVSRADRPKTPVMEAFESFLQAKGSSFLPHLAVVPNEAETGPEGG
jgi:LysR family transcriptional regulator, low CO2-responsive transcriptional regulator